MSDHKDLLATGVVIVGKYSPNTSKSFWSGPHNFLVVWCRLSSFKEVLNTLSLMTDTSAPVSILNTTGWLVTITVNCQEQWLSVSTVSRKLVGLSLLCSWSIPNVLLPQNLTLFSWSIENWNNLFLQFWHVASLAGLKILEWSSLAHHGHLSLWWLVFLADLWWYCRDGDFSCGSLSRAYIVNRHFWYLKITILQDDLMLLDCITLFDKCFCFIER